MTHPEICLITPGHLASTPRIVKNADALAAAGYRVHVISGRHFPPADSLDATLLATAKWASTRVDYLAGWRGLSARIFQRIARRRIGPSFTSWRLAARALHTGHHALVAAAISTGARFFYGHGGVAGLAAAAAAARQPNTAFGFDAEDWHEEETDSLQTEPHRLAAIRLLLRAFLPRATFLTCAAPLIGQAYAAAYHVESTCLLNVFPLAEGPAAPRVPAPPSDREPAVLYWFSQTIGPGRGLEALIDTITHLRTPVVLHLRGFASPDYCDSLRARAGRLADRVVVLPPAPPHEMARLASGAHLGLSLEQSTPRNRDLCLTNKIFTYLLAGVPVALTPTAAQNALLSPLGPAALSLSFTDPSATAATLDHWLIHKAPDAAAHAWRLGQDRFNWDHERTTLIHLVREKLGSPSRGAKPSR